MSDNTGDDLHPVVKMSVVTTDNILSQDNSHLDHRTRCSNIPPRLKPISISHSNLSLFLSLHYHNFFKAINIKHSFLDTSQRKEFW